MCYILRCPEFITAANGTLFQLLFPFLIGFYYKRKGQVFSYLIGLFFLGISLHYTAWYISTAHHGLFLPASKSFLGVDGFHDFNYILTSMHLLEYNTFISALTRSIAYIVMFYSCVKMLFLAFFVDEDQGRKRKSSQRRPKKSETLD